MQWLSSYGYKPLSEHECALATEHGACIATTDRDFTRFPDIELVNPVQFPAR